MTKRTQVARTPFRAIVASALAGLSSACLLFLAVPASLALPLYASREGRTCVSCHYDPNGGGMRNDVGFTYSKNRHGVDAEERWAKVTVVPRLNDWIAIGLDTRVLYLATHAKGGSTIGTSTFFPMQGQLNFAISPHEHLTVVSSHGIQIDPESYEVRELYGLTAPPMVTNWVPGVTGGNHPAGRARAMTSAKLTPLSHSSTPEPGSSSILPPSPTVRMVPVGCNALSP